MTFLDLFTLALFTWYVSYVITKTDGPFRIFLTLRTYVKLGGLTQCIACLSIWIAALAYVLMLSPYAPLVSIGAIAGAALMLHRYVGFDHG